MAATAPQSLAQFNAYIDGAFVPPVSGEYFETVNPYTSSAWAEVARCGEAEANAAVDAAYRAFDCGPWGEMTASTRGALLRRLGDLIADAVDTDDHAQTPVVR